MTPFRPTSYDRPGEQISTTPSGGTRWKIFTPALLISLLISDSILVAVGAGVSQGAGLFLGIALLGMFALATISGLAKNKMPKQQNSW